jgi:hypothetical protein
LKSGRVSLVEISGPVQACNGIALPFPLVYSEKLLKKYPGTPVSYEEILLGNRQLSILLKVVP